MLQISDNDKRFLCATQRPDFQISGKLIRFIDLFSGCGGMSLGIMEALRMHDLCPVPVLGIEIVPEIASLYSANIKPDISSGADTVDNWFDSSIGSRLSSIEKRARLKIGTTQILLGGPPCQGHSSLNNHTRGSDPKNRLYLRVLRAAEVLEPDYVLIENVPNVQKDKHKSIVKAAKRLRDLGYAVNEFLIHVADIGVPQLRKRHILFAATKRIDVEVMLGAARVEKYRKLKWAIGDLLKRYESSTFDSSSKMSKSNMRRAKWLYKYDKYDLPNHLRPPCHKDHPEHSYKSMYGRLYWDKPAQTITTGFGSPGQGRYLHPSIPRTLTPHEAARLQFFPDWYSFGTENNRRVLAQAIGNAVPPKLSFVFGCAIAKQFMGK